jgi:hypothetical protein
MFSPYKTKENLHTLIALRRVEALAHFCAKPINVRKIKDNLYHVSVRVSVRVGARG